MEKQLKCVLLLSLKKICLRRVAVLLWSGPDILASISKLPNDGYSGDEHWKLGDKIKDKMLKLELPEMLTNEMIELIAPMRLEVREWKDSQQDLICPSNNAISLPDSAKLCWTTAGTINYQKTAEELLRCDKLDVVQRYKIACYYCLEDRIALYWEELSGEKKDTYLSDEDPLSDLTSCWPYTLKSEHLEIDHLARTYRRNSFNQYAFENSAEEGNKTAAEYFFQKLTHEEREVSLCITAHAVIQNFKYLEDKFPHYHLLYLLSLMTPEQEMHIIKAHPIDIFLCFLRSQLQDLFRENAGFLWALLPPRKYHALLQRILEDYPVVYFPKMIKELFRESPRDFKMYFIKESSIFRWSPAYEFLKSFFFCNHPESIKAVFRNVDAATRVELVRPNIYLFYDYMSKDKWHLVELCLREAMLSKEEKGRLKDNFIEIFEREERGAPKCPVLKRFFEFFDETYASSDQRKKSRKRKLEKGSPEQ